MKELPINQIIQGDCLEVLKTLPDNYVDSIVTDPPYGLSFMGKKWDYDVPSVEVWQECLRVLKPGGYLLSFAGTRTYHRMACAIEDAGFEVRDMIEWVYGSGFPKSLNIGKAVDKLQGNVREVVGESWDMPDLRDVGAKSKEACGIDKLSFGQVQDAERKVMEITKGTSEWEGWGTALKPSHETIAVAQKPFDSRSDIDYTVSICQTLFAQIVKNSSELNLNENTQQSIAQWIAEKNINTLEDLSEVMDMLQSELETNLNLNIVLSWLNILGEIWGAMSMFTTETKGSLTTELKILQSLEWENIFQNITQVKNNQIDGYSANVLNVENLLNAVKLKLKYILTHSAQENAISQANKLNFAPNHEPICMARKPLGEKTVAENVLKYGTGGINIDESRVDGKTEIHSNGKRSMYGGNSLFESKTHNSKTEVKDYGRFPANLIHDGSDEVKECFPNESERFFKSIIYCAKASKSERNRGLDCYVTVKYTNSISNNKNLCKEENTVAVQLLQKVISEQELVNFNIDESGVNIMVQCHQDSLSIILTEIKRIIGLKIYNSLMHSLTNESIQVANLEMENGGNLAESVVDLKRWILTTTKGNQELALGASRVVCEMLQLISVEENWRQATNFHSTVKPIALMEYLIKMVTPKGGIVLDPFAGSGTTLVAAKQNGFQYIGVEITPEYIKIVNARLNGIKDKLI